MYVEILCPLGQNAPDVSADNLHDKNTSGNNVVIHLKWTYWQIGDSLYEAYKYIITSYIPLAL